MLPRPRFRLPIWAALAICGVTYVGRSILRGWDFRPDLPVDAIVLVLLLVVVAMVVYVRRVVAKQDLEESGDDDSTEPRIDKSARE